MSAPSLAVALLRLDCTELIIVVTTNKVAATIITEIEIAILLKSLLLRFFFAIEKIPIFIIPSPYLFIVFYIVGVTLVVTQY
jgi:hypothetical protein